MQTVNLYMNEADFTQLPLSSEQENPILSQMRTVTVLVHSADSSQKVLSSG